MRKVFLFFCLLFSLQMISAQELSVHGVVTSADDSYPLPGVSVVIKGTADGTFTDADGNYSIFVDEGQTLVFSSIGFEDH